MENKKKILNVDEISLNEISNNETEITPVKKKRKLLVNKPFLKYGVFIILLIFIFGVSYSFFSYYSESSRDASLSAADVYVKVLENKVTLTVPKMYPMTKEEARERNDNYVDFTVVGKNTLETKQLIYNLLIENGDNVTGKTRIDPAYIKLDLEELINSEYTSIISAQSLSSFTFTGRILPETDPEIERHFRLRLWVSDEILISDTEPNATYTQAEFANLYATFNISVSSTDAPPPSYGVNMVRASIDAKQNAETNSCNPIWVDDMETTSDETDDITYFSGDNTCVDMNYVWYSGKLWRITAIYPDGAMKLVTEDVLTAIFWGSTVEYDGSWVYQWLNEDFYDTLYNKESIIVSNSTWNYSTDGNSTPVRPESIATQKTKEAPVGLLNAYEYYNAAATLTNYLNINYDWFLITPYSTSSVRNVEYRGYFGQNSLSTGAGVRPSIVIKSDVEFTGEGSKSNPYKIVGDKKESINNITLLNTRSTGEYVNFDDDLYRIVDTSDGITKLTRIDYLMDSGTAITKNFASSAYFGKSSNTQTDTYWDYYLNNNWYNSISSTYKNMLVDGTYYLGLYPNATNYKATICKDVNLNNVTTKNCTKYTSSDTDKTFTGKVGLPRVGEMFSAQLGSGFTSYINIWTITPFAESEPPYYKYVRHVSNYGILGNYSPSSRASGVRPSITLKSGIKITGGTGYVGGDTNSPFEISE